MTEQPKPTMPDSPKPGTGLPWMASELSVMSKETLVAMVSPKFNFSPGMGSCIANMAYIVHAANRLPELEAENTRLRKALERCLDYYNMNVGEYETKYGFVSDAETEMLVAIAAAIRGGA